MISLLYTFSVCRSGRTGHKKSKIILIKPIDIEKREPGMQKSKLISGFLDYQLPHSTGTGHKKPKIILINNGWDDWGEIVKYQWHYLQRLFSRGKDECISTLTCTFTHEEDLKKGFWSIKTPGSLSESISILCYLCSCSFTYVRSHAVQIHTVK